MPKNQTSVSNRFRAARKQLGLSQFQLAVRAECSIPYIQVIERGALPINPDNSPAFQRICEVLGTDPGFDADQFLGQ